MRALIVAVVAFAAGWAAATHPTTLMQILTILAMIGATVAFGNLLAIFVWRISYGYYPPFSWLGDRLQVRADRKSQERFHDGG